MSLKILIIGADGLVGRALLDHFTDNGVDVIATTRRPEALDRYRILLDLRDNSSKWPPFPKVGAVINCSAIAGFSTCRENSGESSRVNVDAVRDLADRVS